MTDFFTPDGELDVPAITDFVFSAEDDGPDPDDIRDRQLERKWDGRD